MHSNRNACQKTHHAYPPDLEARTQIQWALGRLGRQVKKLQVVRELLIDPERVAHIVEVGMHGPIFEGIDVIIADLLIDHTKLGETIKAALRGEEGGCNHV